MKNIRRKFPFFAALAVVVTPLLLTVYLLFLSPNDLSARQTGKQRVRLLSVCARRRARYYPISMNRNNGGCR